MEFDTAALDIRDLYKLMTGAIVPRPIGWVSSLNAAGKPNLAPFSYFNAVSADPPTLMFSGGAHTPDRRKDTVRNVEETGEFVVNIVTEQLAEAMNATAVVAPRGVDEFSYAGVTPAPSRTVAVPRVAESPVHFECRVAHIYQVREGADASTVVFGRIQHIHVDDRLLDGTKIDTAALRPLARLGGPQYAGLAEIFTLERPVYSPKDD
jgi:flavin reductase (DIM6/NTAB) family NADH-FMN oxidoreductase RutF